MRKNFKWDGVFPMELNSNDKLRCVCCGKQLDPNAKVELKTVDRYICAGCFKSLGGTTKINPYKITYDELMNLKNQNINKEAKRKKTKSKIIKYVGIGFGGYILICILIMVVGSLFRNTDAPSSNLSSSSVQVLSQNASENDDDNTTSSVLPKAPTDTSVEHRTGNEIVGISDKDINDLDIKFYKNVPHDEQETWADKYSMATMNADVDFSEYALSYYNEYYQNYGDLHFVINFNRKTVDTIIVHDSIHIFASTHEYLPVKEINARNIDGGKLLDEYWIHLDNGDIEKIDNELLSDPLYNVEIAEPKKYTTKGPIQNSTSTAVVANNINSNTNNTNIDDEPVVDNVLETQAPQEPVNETPEVQEPITEPVEISEENISDNSVTEPPAPVEEPQDTASSATNTPSVVDETNAKTVYVTPTGKKYHYDSSCNGGNYSPSTLREAQDRGLTPCKKCVG